MSREYETLVIIEETAWNLGGGAAYIAAAKKAFAQMYGDVPCANDIAAEPARMNWLRVILTLANRQSVVAEWMIKKMVAGVTMLGASSTLSYPYQCHSLEGQSRKQ